MTPSSPLAFVATLESPFQPQNRAIPGAMQAPREVILLADGSSAAKLVAGIPVAARAAAVLARAGHRECWLIADEPGWRPSAALRAEVARLAPGLRVQGWDDGASLPIGPVRLLSGEALAMRMAQDPQTIADGDPCPPAMMAGADSRDAPRRHELAALSRRRFGAGRFDAASRAIIAATAKPGDGIVSRHINRRISRAVSARLLRLAWIRPGHATLGTALVALVMLAALLGMPGYAGMLTGAVLFQAASILDGVDGEIARATLRCSDRGAMADSLVDAATNMGFIGGIVANLWFSGAHRAAGFGLAGLLMLALGLFIIGRRARRAGGPFGFDGVKRRVRAGGSRLGLWLTWLTMRDFLALAAVVLVTAGMATGAIVAFAVIMAGWLGVVILIGDGQAA